MNYLKKSKELFKKNFLYEALRELPHYEFLKEKSGWSLNVKKSCEEEIKLHHQITSSIKARIATQGARKQFNNYLHNK